MGQALGGIVVCAMNNVSGLPVAQKDDMGLSPDVPTCITVLQHAPCLREASNNVRRREHIEVPWISQARKLVLYCSKRTGLTTKNRASEFQQGATARSERDGTKADVPLADFGT